LDTRSLTLSYWNNVIAIGSEGGDIITLDAITGSRMAVLSGHTDEVNCVTFSSDGRSLASGADDKTVKLWDMQTGGVVRTFLGHTELFCVYPSQQTIPGLFQGLVVQYVCGTLRQGDVFVP
jgi:WD40 repeat protein